MHRSESQYICSECLEGSPPAYCPNVGFEERRTHTDAILYMILFAFIMLAALCSFEGAIVGNVAEGDDSAIATNKGGNNDNNTLRAVSLKPWHEQRNDYGVAFMRDPPEGTCLGWFRKASFKHL